MAILDGLYLLQEALRLAVEEVEPRLVDASAAANFEVVANPTEVGATLG